MEKDPDFRSPKSKKSLKRRRISPCPSGKRFRGSDKPCEPIVTSGFLEDLLGIVPVHFDSSIPHTPPVKLVVAAAQSVFFFVLGGTNALEISANSCSETLQKRLSLGQGLVRHVFRRFLTFGERKSGLSSVPIPAVQ